MAARTSIRRFMPTPRHILFFALPPIQPIDLFGPLEVFRMADLIHGVNATYRIEVACWRSRDLATESGLPLRVHLAAPFEPRAVDTFVVVGGQGAQYTINPRVDAWVGRMSRLARRTVSVCTGAFALARAGILDGRRATTHWLFTGDLAKDFARVTVDGNPIWIEDDGVFTSAGITTGIDLALALVNRDLGARVALETARVLVVYVQRSGGQAQFSSTLAAQRAESLPIREIQAWIADHLSLPHGVEDLARTAGMSPRNFSRVFTKEVGWPPARFVQRVRLEAARRSLERGDRGLEEIARMVGFGSADVMTRAFRRELSTTPQAYREAFRSAQSDRRPTRSPMTPDGRRAARVAVRKLRSDRVASKR
jgi:transcriptional regulator GlxA family with amidase domain